MKAIQKSAAGLILALALPSGPSSSCRDTVPRCGLTEALSHTPRYGSVDESTETEPALVGTTAVRRRQTKHNTIQVGTVESDFFVANRDGITAQSMSAPDDPRADSLLQAYRALVQNAVRPNPDTSFADAQITEIRDVVCPSCAPEGSRCQRVFALLGLNVNVRARTLQDILAQTSDLVDRMIESQDLLDPDSVFDVLDDDPVCNLDYGDDLTIRQPSGVPLGTVSTQNDMGYRFSKNPKLDPPFWNTDEPSYMILQAQDYPVSMDTANTLRTQTAAVSVFHSQDCMDCSDITVQEMIQSTNVTVTYPNSNPDSGFWDELDEVVSMQIHRRRNGAVEPFLRLPDIWTGYSIEQVAQAVHDEYPGIHHVALIQQLFGGALDVPANPNCPQCALVDRNIIPSPSSASFIRGIVMLADLCTWAFGVVGPYNFRLKWHVGRPRPEEIVWKIYNNELTTADGVPQHLVDTIQNQFTLARMQDFTAYPEGSPDHPSFPAMHSASSSSSLWLAVVMDLTEEQWCEAKAVDYAVAYARTIAGVHYYTDNIAGLNLGQEILARQLPKHLATKYGSDEDTVRQKIARLRFDWNDYLTSNCFS